MRSMALFSTVLSRRSRSGVGVGVPPTVSYRAIVLGERIQLRIPCAVISGNAMNEDDRLAGPLFRVEEVYSIDLEARHGFSHHADEPGAI